jgi:hypothetical protein
LQSSTGCAAPPCVPLGACWQAGEHPNAVPQRSAARSPGSRPVGRPDFSCANPGPVLGIQGAGRASSRQRGRQPQPLTSLALAMSALPPPPPLLLLQVYKLYGGPHGFMISTGVAEPDADHAATLLRFSLHVLQAAQNVRSTPPHPTPRALPHFCDRCTCVPFPVPPDSSISDSATGSTSTHAASLLSTPPAPALPCPSLSADPAARAGARGPSDGPGKWPRLQRPAGHHKPHLSGDCRRLLRLAVGWLGGCWPAGWLP